MATQVAVQNTLLKKFAEAQSKNPSFSLRSFARRLGISPATASLILQGKRAISRKMADRLVAHLSLEPLERDVFLASFRERARGAGDSVPLASAQSLRLSQDHFRAISDWPCFAILSLMRTWDFEGDHKWIAGRLGISRKRVRAATESLERLGMIQIENGKWTRGELAYRTTDDVRDASIQKAHAQSLELARESLDSEPVERRDFMSLTLALHADRIPEGKRLIREFLQTFDAAMETNESRRTEVYRLNVQLIPLTKGK